MMKYYWILIVTVFPGKKSRDHTQDNSLLI